MADPRHDYRVPVDQAIKEQLNEIARTIGRRLPEGWGFALLIFEYRPGGTMTWISNAERQDMVKALQEFIQKQAS